MTEGRKVMFQNIAVEFQGGKSILTVTNMCCVFQDGHTMWTNLTRSNPGLSVAVMAPTFHGTRERGFQQNNTSM